MSASRSIIRQLIALGILAFSLRLFYLLAASSAVGFDAYWWRYPDTRLYWTAAEQLLTGEIPQGCTMLWVGPGYISILAGLQAIFGPNPWWAIFLNVLLGSLTPLFIYLVAYQLVPSTRVALIAGLIAAISSTGTVLSCQILADQPAVAFFAAGLASYLRGFGTGRIRWFAVAGLLLTVSTAIRPAGLYWGYFLLVLPLLLPLQPALNSRSRMWARTAITAVIMLVAVTSWSAYNHARYGVYTFATSGTLVARSALLAEATAMNVPGTSIAELRVRWEEEDGHLSDSCAQEAAKARQRVMVMVREHPSWLLRAFWQNVVSNIKAPNAIMQDQLLQLKDSALALNGAMESWLGYLIAGVSLIGLLLLALDRNRTAWLLLGAVYFFFTAVTGFSFWQGSRLHYPAEMAWAILIAYAIHRALQLIERRISHQPAARQS